jgi:hypothetical protein
MRSSIVVLLSCLVWYTQAVVGQGSTDPAPRAIVELVPNVGSLVRLDIRLNRCLQAYPKPTIRSENFDHRSKFDVPMDNGHNVRF